MAQNPMEVCAVFAHGRQILENCAAITQAVNAIGLITPQQQDTSRKAKIQILVMYILLSIASEYRFSMAAKRERHHFSTEWCRKDNFQHGLTSQHLNLERSHMHFQSLVFFLTVLSTTLAWVLNSIANVRLKPQANHNLLRCSHLSDCVRRAGL